MSWVFFGVESAKKHWYYINCKDCDDYINVHNNGKCEYCLHYGLPENEQRTKLAKFKQKRKKSNFFLGRSADLAAYKRKCKVLGVEETSRQMVEAELLKKKEGLI